MLSKLTQVLYPIPKANSADSEHPRGEQELLTHCMPTGKERQNWLKRRKKIAARFVQPNGVQQVQVTATASLGLTGYCVAIRVRLIFDNRSAVLASEQNLLELQIDDASVVDIVLLGIHATLFNLNLHQYRTDIYLDAHLRQLPPLSGVSSNRLMEYLIPLADEQYSSPPQINFVSKGYQIETVRRSLSLLVDQPSNLKADFIGGILSRVERN